MWSNNRAIIGEVEIIIGYVLRVEKPKTKLPGRKVSIVDWKPALANQMASCGRGEH